MHFHPQAGNALSLAFGNICLIQLITGLFVLLKKESQKLKTSQLESILVIAFISGLSHSLKKKDTEHTNSEQLFRNKSLNSVPN